MSPSVLLMSGPPASELDAALLREASRWAHAVAPGRVRVASGDLAEAAGEAFSPGEPLLVVWPELSELRPELATGTLEDLASGCEVVLGPLFDGGLYLLGLARAIEPLLTIDWQADDAMTRCFELAARAGLPLGLQRAERGLRRPEDVRAALADPCLPAGLRPILAARGPEAR
ncbi:MAG TPA: hypothetical protein VLP43_08800 [Solirubrobacteraceae bacterium]|nr:hypothetical protein [Solirubrobacteraceae bacterium]